MTKSTTAKRTVTAAAKPKNTTKKTAQNLRETVKPSGIKVILHSHGHALLAFAYAVQALLVLLLAKTYTVALTSTYIAKDELASGAADSTVFAPASRHFVDINVGYLLSIILLVAALTHLALSIIRKRDTWNDSTIQRHGRRVRWTGLTLSVAGLLAVVALLVGVRDITALAALAGLVTLAGVVGYLVEEHQQISKRIVLLLGFISTVLPTALLGAAVIFSGIYGDLPGLLLAIFLTLLLGAFIAFVAFYFVVIAKKPVRFSVAAYSTILIFVVESAVLWQIFASYLRS